MHPPLPHTLPSRPVGGGTWSIASQVVCVTEEGLHRALIIGSSLQAPDLPKTQTHIKLGRTQPEGKLSSRKVAAETQYLARLWRVKPGPWGTPITLPDATER